MRPQLTYVSVIIGSDPPGAGGRETGRAPALSEGAALSGTATLLDSAALSEGAALSGTATLLDSAARVHAEARVEIAKSHELREEMMALLDQLQVGLSDLNETQAKGEAAITASSKRLLSLGRLSLPAPRASAIRAIAGARLAQRSPQGRATPTSAPLDHLSHSWAAAISRSTLAILSRSRPASHR